MPAATPLTAMRIDITLYRSPFTVSQKKQMVIMQKIGCHFSVVMFLLTVSYAPANPEPGNPEPGIQVVSQASGKAPAKTEIETIIAAAFGMVEHDKEGNIIGIDLARDRASATDDILIAALSVPNLKRFRFAGGNVAAESWAGLKQQHELEELYLQDVPLRDNEWKSLTEGHPPWRRLTLRRLPHITHIELGALPHRLPALRNLSLIEMGLTAEALAEIAKSKHLAALDIRQCGSLTAENYLCLNAMTKLVDLKIGGFAVNDEVLMAVAPLKFLRGLTIDDALLSPKGFERFLTESASVDQLETLVLCRNMSLFDDALVALRKCPKLNRLTINGMMITGTFLLRLAEHEASRPKLRRLSLRKTFLSEDGATALKKYPELRILDLSGIGLTPEIVDIIASMDQIEELDVSDNPLDEEALRRLKMIKSLKN